MKKYLIFFIVFGMMGGSCWAADQRFGGGVNYWTTVDDLKTKEADDNGFSYLLSYQYRKGIIGFELDGEYWPNRFGKSTVAPEAYFLLGQTIYAGIGIGITYSSSELADQPFYALKAGLDLEVLPGIFVDVSANYRFNEREELKNSSTDIDTDTVFLGAALRFKI